MTEAADALFEVRPGDFVKARDALARQLSSEGRRDEAKEVKTLRRPSTPVWALNQLTRRNRSGVDALLRAGADLRAAQEKGTGAGVREANDVLNRNVLELVRHAEQLVVDEGVAAATPRRDLEDALRTAALGGEAADALLTGRLVALPEADEMDMWAAGSVDAADHDQEQGEPEIEEARDLLERADAEAKRARELVEDLTQRVHELEEQLRRERADLESATRRASETARSAENAADRLKQLRA